MSHDPVQQHHTRFKQCTSEEKLVSRVIFLFAKWHQTNTVYSAEQTIFGYMYIWWIYIESRFISVCDIYITVTQYVDVLNYSLFLFWSDGSVLRHATMRGHTLQRNKTGSNHNTESPESSIFSNFETSQVGFIGFTMVLP